MAGAAYATGAASLATGAATTAALATRGSLWTTALKPLTGSAVYSTVRRVPSGSVRE